MAKVKVTEQSKGLEHLFDLADRNEHKVLGLLSNDRQIPVVVKHLQHTGCCFSTQIRNLQTTYSSKSGTDDLVI